MLQGSAQERERPENESPDEFIVNRRTTHSLRNGRLRNGRFRRELNQNIVVLEI